MPADPFIDSNVLIYLLSADTDKAGRAEAILRRGAVINVQVLNEITNVMRRKLAMPWPEVNEFVALIRSLCPTKSLTPEVHDRGRSIAERYNLSVYDAMIVSAALAAGCDTLYSEDMHHSLLVEKQLRVRNPFSPGQMSER
ncbi:MULTISPECIES: PIN domain-containing protein [unclassified Microbulbifer]|uniref:PIN domain-containing protein n=1 Tax=unclassified Microbulbifer TaxID=2619833 RepID=UPI0027E514F3|nr:MULTISPECIES: PIN domain-containing protein [unclassified Microbulbifer]